MFFVCKDTPTTNFFIFFWRFFREGFLIEYPIPPPPLNFDREDTPALISKQKNFYIVEKFFIFATSVINYTKDNQPHKLYKLLAKDSSGKEVELVTSAEPSGPVALATLVKKDKPLWEGGPKAKQDTWQIQYYTSAEQVSTAKAALASIKELEW